MSDPCPPGTMSCLAAGIDDAGLVALAISDAKPNGHIALRSALGAGRGQLVQQVLVEDQIVVEKQHSKLQMANPAINSGAAR